MESAGHPPQSVRPCTRIPVQRLYRSGRESAARSRQKRRKRGAPPLRVWPPVVRPGPSRVEWSRGESSEVESSRVESQVTSAHLTARSTSVRARVVHHGTRESQPGRLPRSSWMHAPDQLSRERSTIDKTARFDLNHVDYRSIDVKLKRYKIKES